MPAAVCTVRWELTWPRSWLQGRPRQVGSSVDGRERGVRAVGGALLPGAGPAAAAVACGHTESAPSPDDELAPVGPPAERKAVGGEENQKLRRI